MLKLIKSTVALPFSSDSSIWAPNPKEKKTEIIFKIWRVFSFFSACKLNSTRFSNLFSKHLTLNEIIQSFNEPHNFSEHFRWVLAYSVLHSLKWFCSCSPKSNQADVIHHQSYIWHSHFHKCYQDKESEISFKQTVKFSKQWILLT